jgi:hypothetical protein
MPEPASAQILLQHTLRLVEQTEAHVLVRFLLLLLLGFLLGLLCSGSSAAGSGSATSSSTTSTAGWHRRKLGAALGDELYTQCQSQKLARP